MTTKNLCTMLMLAVAAAVSLNTAAWAQQVGKLPNPKISDHRSANQNSKWNQHSSRPPQREAQRYDDSGRNAGSSPQRSVSNRSGSDLPNTAPNLPQQPIVRVKRVKKGGWRTLENFWNSKADIVFVRPAGATVKIRYGSTKKYFGKNRQKQRLKGNQPVVLKVGSYSAVRARVQIYVERDTDVTYYVYPGGVNSVKIPF